MSWLSELDIFTFGITLLQFIGEYIEYTPRRVLAFRVINCAVFITVIIFIVSNINDPESEEFVNGLEHFAIVFHAFFKYVMLMYNKKYLKKLMSARMERFWRIPFEKKDLSSKIRNIYKRINLLQIVMLVNVIPVIEIYILSPYINPNNPFIFASNVFVNSVIMDAVVLFCQYHIITTITFIIIGYDFLYLSWCTELIVQVKLLKYKLQEVFAKASEDTVFGILVCVKQHNSLLSVYDMMQKMYSSTLLFHYFATLVTVCFDLYQSFVRRSTLSHEVQKCLSLTGVAGQFAFYCVSTELLSAEFTAVGQDLYSSKWYKSKPEVQKLMLPIMVKSQRCHYFSAAGLLDINMDAFGSVIRKAFSFCAVMRNLLNK